MLRLRCGNGEQIDFWNDVRATEISLRRKFSNLYLILDNRFGKVATFVKIDSSPNLSWSVNFSRVLQPHEISSFQ